MAFLIYRKSDTLAENLLTIARFFLDAVVSVFFCILPHVEKVTLCGFLSVGLQVELHGDREGPRQSVCFNGYAVYED